MARKRKKYVVKSPQLRADAAAWRAAFRRRHDVRSSDDPSFNKNGNEHENKLCRAIVLYAAALGRKGGQLPYDLRDWYGVRQECGNVVAFGRHGMGTNGVVFVAVPNLDWWPADPVEQEETYDAQA